MQLGAEAISQTGSGLTVPPTSLGGWEERDNDPGNSTLAGYPSTPTYGHRRPDGHRHPSLRFSYPRISRWKVRSGKTTTSGAGPSGGPSCAGRNAGRPEPHAGRGGKARHFRRHSANRKPSPWMCLVIHLSEMRPNMIEPRTCNRRSVHYAHLGS